MIQSRLHTTPSCRHGQPGKPTSVHVARHAPTFTAILLHTTTYRVPFFSELCAFFDPSTPTLLHQVRDDNWWRQNAAKALAISAEMKKTPGRSRSRNGTPARNRSRSGTPAHSRSATTRRGGAAPRDGRGTPSSRSGNVVGRVKGRNGGGGSRSRDEGGGWSTEDGAEGGVAGVGESRFCLGLVLWRTVRGGYSIVLAGQVLRLWLWLMLLLQVVPDVARG